MSTLFSVLFVVLLSWSCLLLDANPTTPADDLKFLANFAVEINALDAATASHSTPLCELVEVGSGWGQHIICNYDLAHANKMLQHAHKAGEMAAKKITWPKDNMPEDQLPPKFYNVTVITQAHISRPDPCHFISFGINTDYSFDSGMNERFKCAGLALDPTVTHPRNITNGVTFLKAGANMKSEVPEEWYTWSVPSLFQVWGVPSLYVLKMDCEGCEYQLAHDILKDDPHFLRSVLQLNIEMHFPRGFMKSEKELLGLARLYRILKLEGFTLVHMDDGRCGPHDQRHGCLPELEEAGIKCEPGCRSYLFSRLPKVARH